MSIVQLQNYLDITYCHFTSFTEKQIYISSDRHLYHKNILKYDPLRKFTSLEDHNNYIINEINKLPEDCLLIFLGDLGLGNNDSIVQLIESINIKHKYWVLGNHDQDSLVNKCAHLRTTICKEMWINEYIYLTHYPPVDYDGTKRYTVEKKKYYIHGHTHKSNGKMKDNVLDVSYNGRQLIYKLTDYINA